MNRSPWFVVVVAPWLAWFVLTTQVGCRPHTKPTEKTDKPKQAGEPAMSFTLESPAFKPGQPIPREHTGEGKDSSPPLKWAGVPAETRALALICDDPDAPRPEPWVHWVLYGIPSDLTALPAGIPATPTLEKPAPLRQGKNSWGRIGYGGPMPPPGHGIHHYHFKLFALDTALDLPPGLTKDELLKRIKGHVLATAELIGTYQR